MNLPSDRSGAPAEESPTELDAAYARASLADGSRPSLSARASILAYAQREAAARAAQIADAADPAVEHRAQRISPTAAANDSIWSWRAAAGFVGVAFAGVLALWLYRGNPEAVPQTAVLPPRASPVAPGAAAKATTAAAPVAAPPAAESYTIDAARATAPEPAALAAPRAQMRMEQAADARARTLAAPAPLAGAVSAAALAPAPTPSAAALLQRWFPQALDSDAGGQQYWFVLDRSGAVVRSGQRAWADLPALQRWLEADQPEPRIARVESAHLLNRRGRDVELAYAWAASD